MKMNIFARVAHIWYVDIGDDNWSLYVWHFVYYMCYESGNRHVLVIKGTATSTCCEPLLACHNDVVTNPPPDDTVCNPPPLGDEGLAAADRPPQRSQLSVCSAAVFPQLIMKNAALSRRLLKLLHSVPQAVVQLHCHDGHWRQAHATVSTLPVPATQLPFLGWLPSQPSSASLDIHARVWDRLHLETHSNCCLSACKRHEQQMPIYPWIYSHRVWWSLWPLGGTCCLHPAMLSFFKLAHFNKLLPTLIMKAALSNAWRPPSAFLYHLEMSEYFSNTISVLTFPITNIQGGPKKVSHYQESSLNRIKNRQPG